MKETEASIKKTQLIDTIASLAEVVSRDRHDDRDTTHTEAYLKHLVSKL